MHVNVYFSRHLLYMMKNLSPLFLSLLAVVVFTQCKKDKVDNPDGENPITNEIVIEQNKRLEKVVTTITSTAFLHGNVLDENGNALSGVEVKAGGKSQITDKDGYFVFGEIAINNDFATVKAEKSGFMKGIRTFTPTSGAMNKVEIRLQSRGTAQNLEANNGGELSFDGGKVKLSFPAVSIADADGKSYTGTVKVYARYIHPESEGFTSTMPGNLVGLTDANRLSGMISFGMANVELTDNSGNLLQIVAGKTVKVTMPAIKDAPADMPVWHFNESYGLWVEAGKAVKFGAEYSFEANHFSTWNLDMKVEDAVEKVTITIKSSTNQNLANQKVDIYTSDFSNRLAAVYTDNNGQFTLLRTPKNLGLRIVTECQNLDKTVNITSENIAVTLPNLTGSAKNYQLSGTVKDCESTYANLYFTLKGLTESKISFSGKTNAEGKFETNIILCDVNPTAKYQIQAMVHTGNNTVKLDTIELTFSNATLQKDIDFCYAVEKDNPYLNPNLSYGSVTDIDGNKYATIQIGLLTWMAENLRTTRYKDGVLIPHVVDSLQWGSLINASYSAYEHSLEKEKIYGKLYNWYAVNTGKLCPQGWHIPTDGEWSYIVVMFNNEVEKLRSATNIWLEPNLGATNESGFSGLPGGSRHGFGLFSGMGNYGYWWSATEYDHTTAWARSLNGQSDYVYDMYFYKYNEMSCRCVKD